MAHIPRKDLSSKNFNKIIFQKRLVRSKFKNKVINPNTVGKNKLVHFILINVLVNILPTSTSGLQL